MKSKLAIITVNFENYEQTFEFISYFQSQSDTNFHLFISDLSDRKIKIEKKEFLDVILGQNKGYSHGVNLGIKKALDMGYTQFAVINNDTRVAPSFTHIVSSAIEKNPLTLIGGKIYYEKGFEYHADRYKDSQLGRVLWYAGGGVNWAHATPYHRGVDEVDQGQYDNIELTDFITGCLMCFDKDVIDTVGFWDVRYFLYFEDADYCERAKKNKIPLIYDPSITIWHKNAQSTGGPGSTLHQKYQRKNKVRFGLKYAPLRTKMHLLKNLISGHL